MFTRKRKRIDSSHANAMMQAASSRLQMMQRKWADWMQVKTRHWQPREQKRFLFILCLVMGGFSTLSFLQLFKPRPDVAASRGLTAPQPLPPLIHLLPDPAMPVVADTMVFRRFRQYLDSLMQTSDGKKKFEQFIKERPGFMDSLAYAEKMVQQSFPHYKK